MAQKWTPSSMGKEGGKNRMNSLTPEQKRELAMAGVEARRIKRLKDEELLKDIKSEIQIDE